MKQMTIKEMAKLAGVSPSAVSIVLNNGKGVSDETRVRIQKIIEETQYVPNPMARRLLHHRTDNIAVLFNRKISPLDHAFYSELNAVILRECEKNNLNLMLSSYTVQDGNVQLPGILKRRDVDGILLYGDPEEEVFKALEAYDLPLVLLDNSQTRANCFTVTADYDSAAYLATKHLIDLGHTRIAYLGDPGLPYFNANTFKGFHRAMAEYNLEIPKGWIRSILPVGDKRNSFWDELLSNQKRPTAVMCSADIYAIQLIRVLKNQGVQVPEQISVIGIDNILIGEYTSPRLTTVEIDITSMGKRAVEQLLQLIAGNPADSVVINSSCLLLRESTAKTAV